MDSCIYNKENLDSLLAATLLYGYHRQFGDDISLNSFPKNSKIDTRKFKGKSVFMVGKNLPIDRVKTLSNGAMEFFIINSDRSFYIDLLEYCQEKNIDFTDEPVNSLVKCITITRMNIIFYYSDKLSTSEIVNLLFSMNKKNLTVMINNLDLSNRKEKLVSDVDYSDVVLPLRLSLSVYDTVTDMYRVFMKVIDNTYSFLINNGILIKKVYSVKHKRLMLHNSFEVQFELDGAKYNGVIVNSNEYSDELFKGFYYDDIHQIRMVFYYDGTHWNYIFKYNDFLSEFKNSEFILNRGEVIKL